MKNLTPLVFLLVVFGLSRVHAQKLSAEILVKKADAFSGGPGDTSLAVTFKGRLPGFENITALSLHRPAGMSDAAWNTLVQNFHSAQGNMATVTIEPRGPIATRGGTMRIPGSDVSLTVHPAPAPVPTVNTLLSEIPSPDGRHKAVAFRRDGVTHISILPAQAPLPDASGNVFIAPVGSDYTLDWHKSNGLLISGEMPAPDDEVLRLREFQGTRIRYRDEITSEAAQVRITSVDLSGATMLTVRFEGQWTPPALTSRARLPKSVIQPAQNAVIFNAFTPDGETELAALARRFRERKDQTVSLAIRHSGGHTFLDQTPLFTVPGVAVTIAP